MYVKIAMASTDKVEVLGQPLHIRVFYALSVRRFSLDGSRNNTQKGSSKNQKKT